MSVRTRATRPGTRKVRKETSVRPACLASASSSSSELIGVMRAGGRAHARARAKNVVFSRRVSLPTAPPVASPCFGRRCRGRSTTMADVFRPIRRNAPSTHPGERSVGHGAATLIRGFLDARGVRRSASRVDPRGPFPVYLAKREYEGDIGRHVRFSRRRDGATLRG